MNKLSTLSSFLLLLVAALSASRVVEAGYLRGQRSLEDVEDATQSNSTDNEVISTDDEIVEEDVGLSDLFTQFYKQSSTYYAEFPKGIFDIGKKDDTSHIRGIQNRCSDFLNDDSIEKKPQEILACKLYFDRSNSMSPMALGPLRTKSDIISALGDDGYRAGSYTPIFKDNAMALMIESGCFLWSGTSSTAKMFQRQYDSTETYSKTYTEDMEITSNAEIPVSAMVTISAGYEYANSESLTQSKEQSYSYGKKGAYANIGSVENQCLTTKMDVLQKYNLVEEKWIEKYSKLSEMKFEPAVTSLDDFADYDSSVFDNEDFKSVAEAGQIIPSVYEYGVEIHYTISTTYTGKTKEVAKEVRNAISVGLAVDLSRAPENSTLANIGNQGSFENHIQNTVKKAINNEKTESQTDTTVHVRGAGKIDIDCLFDTSDAGSTSCINYLSDLRQEIRQNGLKDLNKPIKGKSPVSLASFVRQYTGKPFGQNWEGALNMYFSHKTCSARQLGHFLGDGKTSLLKYNNGFEPTCGAFNSCRESVVYDFGKSSKIDVQENKKLYEPMCTKNYEYCGTFDAQNVRSGPWKKNDQLIRPTMDPNKEMNKVEGCGYYSKRWETCCSTCAGYLERFQGLQPGWQCIKHDNYEGVSLVGASYKK